MFYRKYRPLNFSEVFGNTAIITSLKNLILKKQIPHAFIFYGPRGTGKTSIARILAKSLLCENYEKNNDCCLECSTCLEVASLNYPDLIEIDAASNNSVENIRYINDKIALSPTRGKLKFYIIDEVHMLSKGAFNALLKTLEEPPKNTYFVLATTEIEKIPDTVKSRCQLFEFKRASVNDLVSKLEYIVNKENKKVKKEDLIKIAQFSRGGFRDSETMLESLILGDLSINEILNTSGDDFIIRFFDLLFEKDAQSAINLAEESYKSGSDVENFNKQILDYLHKLILIKYNIDKDSDINEYLMLKAKEHSQIINENKILTFNKIFNQSLEQIKYAYIPILPLICAIIEICGGGKNEGVPVPNLPIPKDPKVPKAPKSPELGTTKLDESEASNEAGENSKEARKEVKTNSKIAKNFNFDDFLQLVENEKPSISLLLSNMEYLGVENNLIKFRANYLFHKERLEFNSTKSYLLNKLEQIFGKKLDIYCEFNNKEKNLTDKNIQYVTIDESLLPKFTPIEENNSKKNWKGKNKESFPIPLNDENFIASPITLERLQRENSSSSAIEEFSGDFVV